MAMADKSAKAKKKATRSTLEAGVFTLASPRAIALSLKRSALASKLDRAKHQLRAVFEEGAASHLW
jgi:hypothetical protein